MVARELLSILVVLQLFTRCSADEGKYYDIVYMNMYHKILTSCCRLKVGLHCTSKKLIVLIDKKMYMQIMYKGLSFTCL